MAAYHFPDNGGGTRWITHDYKWNNYNPEDKDILSHTFERYGGPGSSSESVIYRDATEPARFIDRRDQINSLSHLYAEGGARQLSILPTLLGLTMCRCTITVWGLYGTVIIRRLGNLFLKVCVKDGLNPALV